MKAAVQNPEASRTSRKELSTFKGGKLTVAEYLRWVRALPPPYVAQLRVANDSALRQFARVLSLNLLLLRQADSAKVNVTPDEWKQLYARYTDAVDSLRSDMGFTAADTALPDSAVAAKVSQYFDGLVAGKVRMRPVPSALGTRAPRARRLPGGRGGREPRVRAGAGGDRQGRLGRAVAPAPAPGMQRAPGGPPVPGPRPRPHRRSRIPREPEARSSRRWQCIVRSGCIVVALAAASRPARSRRPPRRTCSSTRWRGRFPCRRIRSRSRLPTLQPAASARGAARHHVHRGSRRRGRRQPPHPRVAGGRGDLQPPVAGLQLPKTRGGGARAPAPGDRRDHRGRAPDPGGGAGHGGEGHRSGDRRRRRAADPEDPGQLRAAKRSTPASCARPGSRRPTSTAAGWATSSAAPRCRTG